MDIDSKKNETMRKFIQRALVLLNNDESKKYIQIYLIDPIMSHVLERIFPYIIITSVLFIILILCIVMICVFIFYNIKIENARAMGITVP
jgi:hypothetical protein